MLVKFLTKQCLFKQVSALKKSKEAQETQETLESEGNLEWGQLKGNRKHL